MKRRDWLKVSWQRVGPPLRMRNRGRNHTGCCGKLRWVFALSEFWGTLALHGNDCLREAKVDISAWLRSLRMQQYEQALVHGALSPMDAARRCLMCLRPIWVGVARS